MKISPKIAAAIIGVVLLFLILLFTTDLFSPRKIEIPDLKNYSLEDGTKKLKELGFIVSDEIREIHDDEVEEGYIVETDPEKGKTRIKGSEITLYVSLGAETYEMANYMGESLDQVQKIIDESDFAEVKINREYSNEPTGTIIGQEPAAGEEIIVEETTLVLTVSAGKNLLNVGNLKGYNKSNLSDYEKSSGLKVRILREEFNNDVAADFVISQSPQAGEKLEEGGTIDVVISKAPAEENPVLNATTNHSIPHTINRIGFTAIKTPNSADTPLPPLKPNQIGKQCPIIANNPHQTPKTSPPTYCPNNTANIALNMSSNHTKPASRNPPTRITLVAPILPEPGTTTCTISLSYRNTARQPPRRTQQYLP